VSIVPHIVFATVLLLCWSELETRRGMVFVGLWLAGWVASSVVPLGPWLFSPYVAMLDIVLVLIVFKGDIRLR